jgi:hypothetical protein
MLISPALAAHGEADTGSSGGGAALLIILGVVITLALVYLAQKRWRSRMRGRDHSGK